MQMNLSTTEDPNPCPDCGREILTRAPWDSPDLPGPCIVCAQVLRNRVQQALETQRWNLILKTSLIPAQFHKVMLSQGSKRVQVIINPPVQLGGDVTWCSRGLLAVVDQLRQEWRGNVLLEGPAGVGKSRLAAGWLLDMARADWKHRIRWLSVPDCAQVARLGLEMEARQEWEESLVALATVQGLVIDALDAAPRGGRDALEALIRRREGQGLMTLITSRNPWPWSTVQAKPYRVEGVQ